MYLLCALFLGLVVTETPGGASNIDVQQEGKQGAGAREGAGAVPSRALLAASFVGTDWNKLAVQNVPMPNISTATTVIVQVVGSSVNPVDWKLIEARLFPGLPASFPAKLGMDMAGVVAKVGPGCTRLKVGDEVWADLADDGLGGYATYAAVEESHLGLKPPNLAWDSASVLPLVSMTSLAALKTTGAPWPSSSMSHRGGNSSGDGPGPVVMILGGSGGCGFTGIQMAKAFGASEIWTTTAFLNFDFVKTMGATRVFDYKTQDWTKLVGPNSVDVVYDTVGVPGSADKCMRPLKAGGWFVTIAGDLAKTPKQGVKQQFIQHWPKNVTALDEIAKLVTDGKLIAEIQSVYSIYDMAQAFDDSQGGQVVGKLFINTTAGPDDVIKNE